MSEHQQGHSRKRQRTDDVTDNEEVSASLAHQSATSSLGEVALKVEASDNDVPMDDTPTNTRAAGTTAQDDVEVHIEELAHNEANHAPALEGIAPPGPLQMPPSRSSVWFDDGNCFVIADNRVAQVYRGLLERHSSVFKHILANRCFYTMPDSRMPIIMMPDGQLKHVEILLRWTLGER